MAGIPRSGCTLFFLRQHFSKPISWVLILVFLFQTLNAAVVYALTSGPSQPEYSSFARVNSSDLVDPFTGDFSYSIPLMEVGSYPINLTYNAGIKMDQEASWVGLGWNIDLGAITRQMNGIPDDFNGTEKIKKEINIRPNRTVGVGFSPAAEFFGFPLELSADMGMVYNNYRGLGFETGISLAGKASAKNTSANLSYSTMNGFEASIGMLLNGKNGSNGKVSAGINSRTGQVSFGLSLSKQYFKGDNSISSAQQSFFPVMEHEKRNININFLLKLGAEFVPAVFANATIKAYYSEQAIKEKSTEVPGYGYLYLQDAEDENVLLDFNRYNDKPFSPKKPDLPFSKLTYDQFVFSTPEGPGSFRLMRTDVGIVHDRKNSSNTIGIVAGIEPGVGYGFEIGLNLGATWVRSTVTKWDFNNTHLYKKMSFIPFTNEYPRSEPVYFMSTGEKASTRQFYNDYIANRHTVRVALKGTPLNVKADTLWKSSGSTYNIGPGLKGTNRDSRSEAIGFITAKNAESIGEFRKIHFYPVNQFLDNDQVLPSSEFTRTDGHKKSHHISVFNITKPNGRRYVYANPVYNLHWEEAVFNVGSQQVNNKQLVNYVNVDASTSNKNGKDHFFSKTTIPAYAYSYLLTSILSNDYIDVSSDGPTPDDFGDYVKFNHSKIYSYFNWRTPTAGNAIDYAAYQENMHSRQDDNYGTYQYGQKEICYPHSIETKNYIAVFILSDRKDAFGVQNERGAMDFTKPLKKLDAIKLYTRADLENNRSNAVPIKTIVFEYDYSLCPQVPNNNKQAEIINNININGQYGKLTLKKVSFVYGTSNRGYLSPYKFEYTGLNPAYNRTAYDRWGYYKPTAQSPAPNNLEYPYTIQNKTAQDQYSSAWNLTSIQVPSGGKLEIEYESDDYAYVQNTRAGRMFMIAGIGRNSDYSSNGKIQSRNPKPVYVYVELDAPLAHDGQFRRKYKPGQYLYFNCYIDLTGQGDYDYIKGYGEITDAGVCPNNNYGWLKLKNRSNGDWQTLNLPTLNPITKSALQFTRANLQDKIFPQGQLNFSEDKSKLARSLLGIIADFASISFGMNSALLSVGYCNKFNKDKSWVRLLDPDGFKLGGGCRVKSIKTSDNWVALSGSDMEQYYGQEFEYTTRNQRGDLISSGVASFEPQIGGDENSMRTPVFYKDKSSILSKNVKYAEKPYTESCYPSPGVGYSKVTVKNLPRPNAKKRGAGHTVYRYHTASTHPTISAETKIKMKRLHPALTSVTNFLLPMQVERTTVSKGYYTRNNDMHGKLISSFSYSEFDDINPVSGYKYDYFYLGGAIPTVNRIGGTQNLILGRSMDITLDSRVERTIGGSLSVGANIDFFFLSILPVITITAWPELSGVSTSFKSVVVNKTDFNKGIVRRITTWKDGSFTKSENVLFNSETGSVVSTYMLNEFGDREYTTSYPAYWMYPMMGTATDNLTERGMISLVNGIFTLPNNALFFEGDELIAFDINSQQSPVTRIHCWITQHDNNDYMLRDANGQKLADGFYLYQVIRSGKRNNLSAVSLQISSLATPTQNNLRNYTDSIIHANAVTYSDKYKAPCTFTIKGLCEHGDCLDKLNCVDSTLYDNPYYYGIKGRWHSNENFIYNADRNYEQNTNADWSNSRFDGLYENFDPFWKYSGSYWAKSQDPDWTRSNRSTILTLEGNEVESTDALGIYSSALYGYNQTLPVAVAKNSRYDEMFYDNMEEYGYISSDSCSPLTRKLLFDFSTLSCLNGLNNGDLIATPADSASSNEDPNIGPIIDTLSTDSSYYPCNDLFITDVASHTGIYSYIISPSVKHNFPVSDTSDCTKHFSLTKNKKYLISLWLQERDGNGPLNLGYNVNMKVSFFPGSSAPAEFQPTGIRIEGWQKLDAVVTIPSNADYMTLKFESEGNNIILLDDMRISPWSSTMKSYAYHPITIQLMATLDENNYATFYEYDAENNLTRIKRETERGIQSVSESNFNLHKTPP